MAGPTLWDMDTLALTTRQSYSLASQLGEDTLQRLRATLKAIDPAARVRIDRERRELHLDTLVPGERVADALVRAGFHVRAWAAELPHIDDDPRRSLPGHATQAAPTARSGDADQGPLA